MAAENADPGEGRSLSDQHRRIGHALHAAGFVTHQDLAREIDAGGGAGGALEEGLLKAGFPSEDDLIAAALARYRIPRIRLENHVLSPDTLRLIPGEVAVRSRTLPLAKIGNLLVLATPYIDARRAAAVSSAWGGQVILVLASPEEVEEALRAHYPAAYAWARAIPAIRAGDLEPQTLVPALGRVGDLPAWWRTTIVGEGPVIPPEAPETG
ncbi:MAG: hypothetical protein O7H41_06430 [Planctomycetota bacterium]|nr:hypothetical protein [Planctomycetota bacterium]